MSLLAHVSSMAKTNSDALVSGLPIWTKTIGRITLSSGAMKFSMPVALNQMDGFSFSSSSSAPLFSSPVAASFLALESAMIVVSNPMGCIPPLRGAGVWPSCLKRAGRPWKIAICPLLLHSAQMTFFLSGQCLVPCCSIRNGSNI